jgi:hypothetical protein
VVVLSHWPWPVKLPRIVCLVFYVIALGVAISSPLISRAIEFAALTAD